MTDASKACPPQAQSVREQLEKVLASEAFARSDRSSRFLRFTVESALEGQTARLKESCIAVELFDRKPSFSPRLDPIVRAEAARLRGKLGDYYETEGRLDPLVIELPKGGYVPAFRVRELSRGRKWRDSLRKLWIPAAMAASLILGFVAYHLIATSVLWSAGATGRNQAVPTGPVPSIVVRPFADLSPNKDQEYFCDGLTEELIEALTRVHGLRVASRTSSYHFKGATDTLAHIREHLRVDMVLEGTVRRSGDRLRINAQLVDAATDDHLWSEEYERRATDTFGVQDEISRALTERLRLQLRATGAARPAKRYVPNAEAYQSYLHGVYFARQWGEDGLRKAVDYFKQATLADPAYAEAYSGLADSQAWLGVYGAVEPKDIMPQAGVAAAKAIELDGSLAHAHASLGLVKAVYDWDWKGAEQEFERALSLDPADALIRECHLMAYVVPRGTLDHAVKTLQQAPTYDPVAPRVVSVEGLAHFYQRDYDAAIARFQKTLELSPHFYAAYLALGASYAQKAQFADAVTAFEKGRLAWSGGMATSLLAHAYARMGRKHEAKALLDQLERLSKERYVSGIHLATIYMGLADRERALSSLERAVEQRSPSLVYLKVDPRFDGIRSEPRFSAMLRRVGLE